MTVAATRGEPLQMIRCRVAGYTLGLQSSCPHALERLGGLMSSLVAPECEAQPDVLYQLDADTRGYRLSRGLQHYQQLCSSDLLATLLTDLSTVLVESTQMALLHAGAAATSDSCLVIAGYSGSGKTTLSAALTKAGLRFLSDEFTPLSLHEPRVTPLPLPLKFREETLTRLPRLEPEIRLHDEPFVSRGERVFFGVPAASALAAYRSWPLAAVVLPMYRCGEDTVLRRIRPGLAVGFILEFVLNWRALGPSAFHVAASLTEQVPCYELIYGQVDRAIEQLLTLVH